MISFIIPTLWKSRFIHSSIESIVADNSSELILIDNADSDYTHSSDKVTIIKPNKNLFVNPAWNLGVAISRGEYICLLNDDIQFNFNTFIKGFNLLLNIDPNFGIYASHIQEQWVRHKGALNKDNDELSIQELDVRVWGFGMMMLMHRDNFHMIPSELKIFFGDDYLYAINHDLFNKKCYWAKGLKYTGEFHASSSESLIGRTDIEFEASLWGSVWDRERRKLKL